MLDFVRKHATSWIIKVALFFIVIVFIFWGGYAYQARQKSHLARVGDVYITWKEYNRTYDRLVDYYKKSMGEKFNDEAIKNLDLKHRALELLIEQAVLLQKAHELGIRVSAAELQEAIKSMPAFQANGRFDPRIYRLILARNHLTPEMFEYQMMQSLTIKKLENFIKRQAIITGEEVLDYIRNAKTEKKYGYVIFKGADYVKDVKVNDEALKAYYESHKSDYREPEQRRIAYVFFDVKDFSKKVSVTDDEIKDYYDEHYKEYNEEKRVKASHILFKVPYNASPEEVEKVKAKALKVLNLAKSGEDFAELARKYSEGPSAKNGGELGYFTKKDMVPEFANAAFKMKPGEISDLVRSPYGFHIIKVEDVKPAHHKTLEEVKDEIRNKLVNEKARDIAFEAARRFADIAFASRDITKAAKRENLKASTPENWYKKTDSISDIGEGSKKVIKQIFSLPEGGITDVIEVDNGFVVAQVKTIKPERELTFEEAKNKVDSSYRMQEAKKIAYNKAKELLKAAIKSGSLETAAKEKGLEYSVTKFMSRMKPDFSMGIWGSALDELLILSKKKPFPDNPLESFMGYVACQWLETRMPDEETIKADIEKIKPVIEERIAETYWAGWKKLQIKNADVEILQKI